MSERRNTRKYKEPEQNVDPKFYFFIFTIGSIAMLAGILWLFGIDFGFFQLGGGVITVGTALWFFVGALVIEYFVDVAYARNLYKRLKINQGFSYIPFLNCFMLYGKAMKVISIIPVGLIIISILFMATPIMTFINPEFINSVSTGSVAVVVFSLFALFGVRGYHMMKLKIDLINEYTKLVGVGAAPALGFFKSILYYIPIIRIVLMFEDLTFINNVFSTITKARQIERGDL